MSRPDDYRGFRIRALPDQPTIGPRSRGTRENGRTGGVAKPPPVQVRTSAQGTNMTESTCVPDALFDARPRPRAIDVDQWRSYVVEDANGCLVWQGQLDRNGYARLGGKWAHRAVYEHEVGQIPERHELDHVCENPPCVNPDHLDPVTRAEHCARTMRRLGKDDKHQSAAYLRTLGLTYGEIAETLEYQGKEGAHGAVLAAIRKGLVDPDEVPRFEPLSEQDCQDIVELRAMGVPVNDLAEWYGIHPATASRLSRGSRTGAEVA